jgi:hypothetical protein
MPYTTITRKEREEAAAMDVDEGDEQQVLDEEEEPDAEEEIEGDDDNDPHRLNRGSGKRKRVTQCEFYSYLISIRNYFNQVLAGGPLTQQWIVDSYVKIEANRVKYISVMYARNIKPSCELPSTTDSWTMSLIAVFACFPSMTRSTRYSCTRKGMSTPGGWVLIPRTV